MTNNLAAAVELVDKWCRESSEWKADKRKQLIPSHFDLGRIKALDQCSAELKTILAELGRGAGGEPDAYLHTIIDSTDGEEDLALSFSHESFPFDSLEQYKSVKVEPLYTRPPVSGLAELTDEQWGKLYLVMRKQYMNTMEFNSEKAMVAAARKFLGKVDG